MRGPLGHEVGLAQDLSGLDAARGDDAAPGVQPGRGFLVEVLASAGIVGLVGFLIMWIGVLVVLWHVDPRFGTLAFAIVFCRLVQAQFDLFWVAVQVSVPFVVAGIYALGRLAWQGKLLRTLGNSLYMGMNPLLPQRLRKPISPELLHTLRLGGAIFAGTLIAVFSRLQTFFMLGT